MHKAIKGKEIIFGLLVIFSLGIILLPLFLSEEKGTQESLTSIPATPEYELTYKENKL